MRKDWHSSILYLLHIFSFFGDIKIISVFKRFASLSIVKNADNGNHDTNNSNNYNHHPDISNLCSILIVDDEIDILSIIRRWLEEYGLKACCFTKASHALEHYKLIKEE
jgi:hypothetical protein